MKKSKQKDERVLAQQRKIGSDAFCIVWIGLIISVLVQQYAFDAPFKQYAVEIVMFIAMSCYILIRNLISGNDLFASKKGGQLIVVINSLVCGITVTAINTILNYGKYSDRVKLPSMVNTLLVAVVTFISATITAFIALELLHCANKKKQHKIESDLDDNE